jgi:hypothetical protein
MAEARPCDSVTQGSELIYTVTDRGRNSSYAVKNSPLDFLLTDANSVSFNPFDSPISLVSKINKALFKVLCAWHEDRNLLLKHTPFH